MKRIICSAFVFFMLLQTLSLSAHAYNVSAQAAVLMEADSGDIIFEKNKDTKLGMASTTKIMTALVAIENSSPSDVVNISDKAIGVEGSSIYLKHGEKLTMEELLYALMLQSANDAAAAIAYEVGGSIENFACMMNQKAEQLGLQNTHFTNPHGLYDENHYTSAHDLAVITRSAMQNEFFRQLVSTKRFVIQSSADNTTRVLINHNKLLKIYDGAIGVKTGFTKKTGRCLVSSAERNGVTLIAVTLNASDDWNDHMSLFNEGFELYQRVTLAEPMSLNFKLPVIGSDTQYVEGNNEQGLSLVMKKGDINITKTVELNRFYFAPLQNGDTLGQVVFFNNGQEIGRLDIKAKNDAPKQEVKKKLFGIF